MGSIELVLSIAWLAIVAWLLLRAFRQNGVLRRIEPCRRIATDPPPVAIIVPARDEAGNIGACLSTLVAQTYPADRLELVVVDDHSSDATPTIVADMASVHHNLTLLRSPPLPGGWVGKCHACWIGACAVSAGVEWLCFIDADVRAEPLLIATAVAEITAARLDFLSLAPHQKLCSFAERLVMPCGLYLLAFRQDLRRTQAPDSEEAAATGQFIMVRRSAYCKTGGHLAVRREICEDVELARLTKRAGGRVTLARGDRLLATRMYDGWSSLWLGVSKNLVDMLGGPLSTSMTAIFAIVLAWAAVALPLLDGIGCDKGRDHACLALAAALPASASAFGLHLAGAVFFQIPPWYGLLFPFGYSAGAVMALDSVRRRVTGRTTWKGRIYP